jgi:hypothetical protein
VELWELEARESIRDLVIRYNANGDSGRFEAVLELFSADARFELIENGVTDTYDGISGIRKLLDQTKMVWAQAAEGRDAAPYVRHFVTTHQIDLVDRAHGRGRSYVAVVMAHGLDHWGRYLDDYVREDERWLISRRRAFTDGRAPRSPRA